MVTLAAAGLMSATPAASADFYQGKTINLVIGYSVGGGYDLYARVLGKYLGKHIPGNPTVVPQNMVGAGSLRAANYLYSVAAKDGMVIGTFSRSVAIAPLISSAQFDALTLATPVLARPFAAPPRMPVDRKAIIRKAFDDTMNDPEFRAKASKLGLDVNPISGSSIDALLKDIYETPKDIVAKVAKAIAE